MKKYVSSARKYNFDKALSSDSFTRAEYAGRIKDPELQEIYVYDPDWFVRAGLARNSSISDEIMRTLAEDNFNSVLFALTDNPNVTPEILDIIADNHDVSVRDSVARHPKVLTDTLIKMYRTAGDEYLFNDYCRDCLRYLKGKLRRRGVNYEEIH